LDSDETGATFLFDFFRKLARIRYGMSGFSLVGTPKLVILTSSNYGWVYAHRLIAFRLLGCPVGF
jgi:hypothetical protein